MKFSKTSQLALASAIGLAAASLLAGCQLVTIDYVFVACSAGATSGSTGEILTYATDSQSGALRPVNKSVTSGISDPVALATSSNFFSLYVANRGNNSVAHFGIADTGVLSPLDTVTTTEPPVYLAVNQANTYLYAADYGSANVLGYSVSSGVLQPLSGSPYPAGNQPSAIVANPNYPYLFVANSLDGTVSAYSISNGTLTRLGSFATGLDPVAIGVDPSTNRFVYTANFLSNNVNNFVLGTTDGSLLNAQYSPYNAHPNPTAVAAIPHNGTGGGIKK